MLTPETSLDIHHFIHLYILVFFHSRRKISCKINFYLKYFVGAKEVAKTLIQHGADLNAKTMNGDRPRDIALKRGKVFNESTKTSIEYLDFVGYTDIVVLMDNWM